MDNVLIRQINIDLITDAPNPMIEWFKELWSKLYVIELNVYHNMGGELIYYNTVDDNKEWVFYQDIINDRFWCNYNNYWSYFVNKTDFDYQEIQTITKILLVNCLNNSNGVIPIPDCCYYLYSNLIDKKIKE